MKREGMALAVRILDHWRAHCPQMVRDLEVANRLEQALFEAQTQTGDLLYELVSVKKMDYQAAWELAMEEWALKGTDPQPSSKRRSSEQSKSPTSSRRPYRRRRATSA